MTFRNPIHTKELRRQLRKSSTEAEQHFWDAVRGKQLLNLKVRRQYGIGPYILDFYFPELKIAVEIDGKIHLKPEVIASDKNKEAFLKENEIELLRFSNEDINEKMDEVLKQLRLSLLSKMDKSV
ncbi:MAG: DUF559 domain-containing protein [Balneolaceae bacterium]|nr:DUF559 domain-containing protein [Balneolaceae bacterium]